MFDQFGCRLPKSRFSYSPGLVLVLRSHHMIKLFKFQILQELALQQKMLKEVDEIISMSFELVTKSLSTGNPHNPADVQSLMINSNAPSIPGT